jgi:hypothetical protein
MKGGAVEKPAELVFLGTTSLYHVGSSQYIAEDDDQVSRMASLNNRAHILSSMGNSADAVGLLLDAVAIAQETGHRHREAALLSHLADNYHRQGDTALAEETQEKAVALFADIDSGQWEPEVWLMTRW